MNIPSYLAALKGEWVGKNRLWIEPETPVQESVISTWISVAARGRFFHMRYTWVFEREPQEGLILIGFDDQQQVVQGVWIDSWHMGEQMMICKGRRNPGGIITLRGSYPAPPGPDWDWQIELYPDETRRLRMLMFNINPDGDIFLAVQAELSLIQL
jgi:hypothetical protein